MESTVILVKVDEMCNILKTLLASGNCTIDEGGIGLLRFVAAVFSMPPASSASHNFLLIFHKTQIINVTLSSIFSTCSKWMHFQHALPLWELQQITDMLHVRQITENFLSLLLRMFIIYFTSIRMQAEIQMLRKHLIL